MRTNRRVLFFFSALIFGGLLFDPALPLPAAPAKHAPAQNIPAVPPSLGVVSTGFSATLPDPKRPGKLLYEIHAASGTGQSDASGFHGALTTVWAKLYQNGFASAILTAPRAQGGSASKSVIITGLGGVVVKSQTQKGTVLTADTVVWYAAQNKMVATGHVYYHDGKTGYTMTGPRMVADTRLKSITISNGHGTAVL